MDEDYKYYDAISDDPEVDEIMLKAARILMSLKFYKPDDQEPTCEEPTSKLKLRIKLRAPNESEEGDINKPSTSSKPRRKPDQAPSTSRSIRRPEPRAEETPAPARPPLPELQNVIGRCSRPMEKLITPSDGRRDLCRLMLAKSSVEAHLLPMLNPNEDVVDGILVNVYGPDGTREYAMNFALWSNKFYVLCNKVWNQFREDYGLQPLKHKATIWMFRHNQSNGLCFVITWKCITDDQHEHGSGESSRKRTAEEM